MLNEPQHVCAGAQVVEHASRCSLQRQRRSSRVQNLVEDQAQGLLNITRVKDLLLDGVVVNELGQNGEAPDDLRDWVVGGEKLQEAPGEVPEDGVGGGFQGNANVGGGSEED